MILYCDGSTSIGGFSAYCFVGLSGPRVLKVLEMDLSVSEIEYLALIKSLEFINLHGSRKRRNIVYSDSLQVVSEVNGLRLPTLSHLYAEAMKLLSGPKRINVCFIGREDNKAGHCLDKRRSKLRRHLPHIIEGVFS